MRTKLFILVMTTICFALALSKVGNAEITDSQRKTIRVLKERSVVFVTGPLMCVATVHKAGSMAGDIMIIDCNPIPQYFTLKTYPDLRILWPSEGK